MFSPNDTTKIVLSIKEYFINWEDNFKEDYKTIVKDFTKEDAISLSHLSYNSSGIFVDFNTKEESFQCKISWEDYLKYLNIRIGELK